MDHIDVKYILYRLRPITSGQITLISILNFEGRFWILPRKYFLSSQGWFWKMILPSISPREILKGEYLFSLSKGDFKGRISLPYFRREIFKDLFSLGEKLDISDFRSNSGKTSDKKFTYFFYCTKWFVV